MSDSNKHPRNNYYSLFDFSLLTMLIWASLVAQRVNHLTVMWETWVQSLGREDPLEKEMATHSSTLAWKIPWAEEPSRLLCNSVTVLIASEIPGLLGEIRLKGTSRGALKKLHIKYYFPQQLSACFVPDSSRCWHSAVNRQNPLPDGADITVGGNSISKRHRILVITAEEKQRKGNDLMFFRLKEGYRLIVLCVY